MFNKTWLLGIGLIGLLSGCAQETPSSPDKGIANKPFFDLEAYFQGETQRLTEASTSIFKRTSVNDKSEEMTSDSINWATELKAFSDSDINRASWVNKYAGDTLLTSAGTIQQIRYEALDDKLRVQAIEIQFSEAEEITSIELQKKNRSLIADSDQQLVYQPMVGYSLSSQQKVLFSGKTEVEVRAEFQ